MTILSKSNNANECLFVIILSLTYLALHFVFDNVMLAIDCVGLGVPLVVAFLGFFGGISEYIKNYE